MRTIPTIVAELTGLRNGILMDLEEGIDDIIIKEDNLAIGIAILGKWQSS